MTYKKKSQAGGPGNSSSFDGNQNDTNNKRLATSSISLIDRLENVQSTGPDSWRASCPHHQGKSRSLSIRYEDRKLLVRCFAGCTVLDIVQSVGLTLGDLFDKNPYSKPVARQFRIQKNARETLEAIQIPVTVLMLGINRTLDGKLTVEELDEIDHAYRTISNAMALAGIQTKELEEISRRIRNAA